MCYCRHPCIAILIHPRERRPMEEAPEDTTCPTLTNEEISAGLAARALKGRDLLAACEDQILSNLKVGGKSLRDWGRELRVSIPKESTDIDALARASADVARAIQQAEYILGLFEVQAHLANNYHDQEFARRYVEEMKGNKKIAAEKLKQSVLVDTTVDSTLAASQAARVIVDFFKKIVKGLEETRKGLENNTRLLGLRMRFLHDQ